MAKIKLNFSEILLLKKEIYGIIDQAQQKVLMEGLLKQKISFPVKYWINELGEKISPDEKRIGDAVNELITKYGEKGADGTVGVAATITGPDGKTQIPNPKMIEFQKEYMEFMKEEKEIEYKQFTFEDLENVVTEEDYIIFRKLIKGEDVKEV